MADHVAQSAVYANKAPRPLNYGLHFRNPGIDPWGVSNVFSLCHVGKTLISPLFEVRRNGRLECPTGLPGAVHFIF